MIITMCHYGIIILLPHIVGWQYDYIVAKCDLNKNKRHIPLYIRNELYAIFLSTILDFRFYIPYA